jgi:hypothetical protein
MNTTSTPSAEQRAKEILDTISRQECLAKITAIIAERDKADAWESTLEAYGVEPERVLEKIKALEQKAETAKNGLIHIGRRQYTGTAEQNFRELFMLCESLLAAINKAKKGQQ